jgi:hypothetical protein
MQVTYEIQPIRMWQQQIHDDEIDGILLQNLLGRMRVTRQKDDMTGALKNRLDPPANCLIIINDKNLHINLNTLFYCRFRNFSSDSTSESPLSAPREK